MADIINTINDYFWTYLLIGLLLAAALWFTVCTGGVQFKMFPEMVRLLFQSSKKAETHTRHETRYQRYRTVSSFQAFAVSIASRVGTGNLAGVATAIALGGPGAVFWMWVVALLGSATAFVESTLAQLFKQHGATSFIGGPAYYLLKGLHSRGMSTAFAILITLTFPFAFSSVQANTITAAARVSFGWSPTIVGVIVAVTALFIVWGGIQRISKFSEIVVPIMAVAYLLLAFVIMCMHIGLFPAVIKLIVTEAFTGDAAMGATIGSAIMMGVRRGLFSNEAGEGSAPNVAATADVSHPVKQGLVQALGVFTDTLLVCTATAFIVLWSGVYTNGTQGIELTQCALESEIGAIGSTFVAIAIFFFGYTTIISNYYYGETNLMFIHRSRGLVYGLRIAMAVVVLIGALTSLEIVWGVADLFMGMMTLLNLVGILLLGKYAFRCLTDYRQQKRQGHDPVYYRDTIPEIADETTAWPTRQP